MALNFETQNIVNLFDSGGITTSDKITGIELRLGEVFIKDNDTHALLSKKKDKAADIYVLVVAVNDIGNVIQDLTLKGFPRVFDNEGLGINRTIQFWQQTVATPDAPSQIHVFVSVIKSRKGLRDTGAILSGARNDPDFANVVTSIKEIAVNATPVGQIANLITSLASIIGKFMGDVEDKPLLTLIQSFTNLAGDFDEAGITPLVNENDFCKNYYK